MKNIIGICITVISFASTTCLSGETGEKGKTGNLTVKITGFPNDKGEAKIALTNSKDQFDNEKDMFRKVAVKIKDKKAEVTFKDVPFGNYAVKAYHDANLNNKLDTNFFGMPTEAYGVSNNARNKFSAPEFSKAKFDFKKSETIAFEVK